MTSFMEMLYLLKRDRQFLLLSYWGMITIGSTLLLAVTLLTDIFPTNLLWMLMLLTWVVGLALINLQWGILSALGIMVFTGFLNRISYNFENVNFQFLFAFPEFSTVILLVIGSLHFVAYREHKIQIFRTLDKWVIIYVCVLILQIFNPRNSIVIGLYGTRMELIPIAMYFLSRFYFLKNQDIIRFYKFLIIIGNPLTCYGIFQHVFGLPNFEFTWLTFNPDILVQREASIGGQYGWFIDGKLRVFSFLQGGQEFHFLIVILFIILAIYQPLKNTEWGWKIGRLSYLGFSLLFLALSLERTPIMMILIGIGIALTIQGSLLSRKTLRWLFPLSVIAMCTIFVLNLLQGQLIALSGNNLFLRRMVEVASPFSAESVESGRLYLWKMTLERIQEFPLGYGLGSTFDNRANQSSKIIPPHNNFLRIAVELGVPGLVIFLIVYLQILRHIMFYLKIVDANSRLLLRAILGIIIAMLACGIFNNPLQTTVAFYFWFLVGLIPVLGSRFSKVRHLYNNNKELVEWQKY